MLELGHGLGYCLGFGYGLGIGWVLVRVWFRACHNIARESCGF